jgi:hypothetical protein
MTKSDIARLMYIAVLISCAIVIWLDKPELIW